MALCGRGVKAWIVGFVKRGGIDCGLLMIGCFSVVSVFSVADVVSSGVVCVFGGFNSRLVSREVLPLCARCLGGGAFCRRGSVFFGVVGCEPADVLVVGVAQAGHVGVAEAVANFVGPKPECSKRSTRGFGDAEDAFRSMARSFDSASLGSR